MFFMYHKNKKDTCKMCIYLILDILSNVISTNFINKSFMVYTNALISCIIFDPIKIKKVLRGMPLYNK